MALRSRGSHVALELWRAVRRVRWVDPHACRQEIAERARPAPTPPRMIIVRRVSVASYLHVWGDARMITLGSVSTVVVVDALGRRRDRTLVVVFLHAGWPGRGCLCVVRIRAPGPGDACVGVCWL